MNERRMSLGNRVISLVLALVMVIGMLPSGLLDFSAFAAPATDDTTTEANIASAYTYAQKYLNANNSKTNFNSKFTWEQEEDKGDTWRYYNGLMLDAMLMFGVGSTNDGDNILELTSRFYYANVTSDGLIARYNSTAIKNHELDSIQPARALFDLLGTTEDLRTAEDEGRYATVLHNMYTEMM